MKKTSGLDGLASRHEYGRRQKPPWSRSNAAYRPTTFAWSAAPSTRSTIGSQIGHSRRHQSTAGAAAPDRRPPALHATWMASVRSYEHAIEYPPLHMPPAAYAVVASDGRPHGVAGQWLHALQVHAGSALGQPFQVIKGNLPAARQWRIHATS